MKQFFILAIIIASLQCASRYPSPYARVHSARLDQFRNNIRMKQMASECEKFNSQPFDESEIDSIHHHPYRSTRGLNCIILHHQKSIEACYKSALELNPNLSGSTYVTFSILPHGDVINTFIERSSAAMSVIDDCIIKMFSDMVFEPIGHPVDTMVVTYPILFRSSSNIN